MKLGRRAAPTISVVVPVYDVAAYLPTALDSLLAQTHRELEVIVVDDGSRDRSGAIAEEYAVRDPRIRVVHTENHGLGAARNEGVRHARGELLAFLDSDDRLVPTAYAVLLRQLRRSGCDLATGSVARWDGEHVEEVRWMRRLHRTRAVLAIDQTPELLGDVFAWNKLFRRSFWDQAGLSWPEGLRYEDQPTLTLAYVRARRIGIVPDVVYHWRVRSDGSSITQQRWSVTDLQDRWTTKRMAWSTVRDYGSAKVSRTFQDKVLPGDLHRYFLQIPDCPDEWWALLRDGVREFWGARSLTFSGLTPLHRLVGWLVENDRREDAAAVISYAVELGRPLDRVRTGTGRRIDVPVIDVRTVSPHALELRDDES